MNTKNYDVAIIGAGIAGLSAAREIEAENESRRLKKKPIISYIIIEADEKIGGRAQSRNLDGNFIINPGAQWLHRDVVPGTPENPLRNDALNSGLALTRDSMPREFYARGGRMSWSAQTQKSSKARNLISEYQGEDISLKDFFDHEGLGEELSLTTTFGEVETGAPLKDVSLQDVKSLVACNYGDFIQEGIGEFVERYAQPVRHNILLNTPVHKIKWSGQGVEVVTKDKNITAKSCIVTTSVGVLKSGNLVFEPELPDSHKQALDAIDMGNFNKVFIRLDDGFKFPCNINTHLDVETDSGSIFYLARDNNQQLVTAFLGGELAKLCDKDPEKAKKIVIDGICKVLGEDLRKHIVDAVVTQWGNEPYILGGYSRIKIGHHNARQKLADPVDGKVFIAGEACGAIHPESGRNWATHMAGAKISGERAANLAVNFIDPEALSQKKYSAQLTR